MKKYLIWTFAFVACTAAAADLVIPLPESAKISRKTVQYQCDGGASGLGLPAGVFKVDYVNGGGNSLAVVPIEGKPMIFVNVLSGSGARYAAQQYIWWEAHNQVNASSMQKQDKPAICKPVQ